MSPFYLVLTELFELAHNDDIFEQEETALLAREIFVHWVTRLVDLPSGQVYLEFGKLPSGDFTTSTGTSILRGIVLYSAATRAYDPGLLLHTNMFHKMSNLAALARELDNSCMGDDAIMALTPTLLKKLNVEVMNQTIENMGFKLKFAQIC